MEIPARSFIPKTTRNRWAWGMAWTSLAVFLFWNLMPDHHYDHGKKIWIKEGMVMMKFWPSLISSYGAIWPLSSTLSNKMFMLIVHSMTQNLALIFLAIMQFSLIPLWRIISPSRLLRFIPACICLTGFVLFIHPIITDPIPLSEGRPFVLLSLTLIALNFLLTTLALLLYQPEPEPIPAS